MLPYIYTPIGNISMFTVFAVCGVCAMLFWVYTALKDSHDRDSEVCYIFPRIVICGVTGFVFAALFDLIFKYLKYGVLKIYGISFYGGLIGATLSMYLILKVSRKKTQYSISDWFNILVPSFILFHIFGRVGCFFGGCCYGKASDSIFAVKFPDNAEMGIFHNGEKCLPTQLYEAVALVVILLVVMSVKNRTKLYFALYAAARFFIEFLRGDDRGTLSPVFSPAQIISLLILFGAAAHSIFCRTKPKKHVSTDL